MSIKSYGQPVSICGVTGGVTGKRAEEELNAARAGDLCASSSTMSLANHQATVSCLKSVLSTSLLPFILVLKAHSIEMDILTGVHHNKASAFQEYVTRVMHVESVLLDEHDRTLSPHLLLVSDTGGRYSLDT